MAKLRSYFAADLDSLRSFITTVLAKSAEGAVVPIDFSSLYRRLESVLLTMSNHDYVDLIRKK